MLRGILSKLENWDDLVVVDRETARMDTDLPIWIVKKVSEDSASGDSDKEVIVNLEPVTGRLLNLSEGSVAVTADGRRSRRWGDLVESWSTDTQVWIPLVAAGVVQVDGAEEGSPALAHLYFLDTPVTEIRRAEREIALADGLQDVAEPASGGMRHVE
jgi:hypothetical protein